MKEKGIVVCESTAFNYPLIKQGWHLKTQDGDKSNNYEQCDFASSWARDLKTHEDAYWRKVLKEKRSVSPLLLITH